MEKIEFDKINATLDRAEFALEKLQTKVTTLRRELGSAKTPEEIKTLNAQAIDLKRQLLAIKDAVHANNPAPHLRLVSDSE